MDARRFLMIRAGFRLNVAKTVTDMLVAWNTDPDLARRAGLAARGRAITPGPAPWGTNIISLDSKRRNNLGEVLGIPAEDSPDYRKYQETPGWNCSDGQGDRVPEGGQ